MDELDQTIYLHQNIFVFISIDGMASNNLIHPGLDEVNLQKLKDHDGPSQKAAEFTWNDEFEAPIFRWIFNRFFTDLLVEYGINAWSLSFKDKEVDKGYSSYLANRTLSRWNYVIAFALSGGGAVIASDYYNGLSIGTGVTIKALNAKLPGVLALRSIALAILLVPTVLTFLRIYKACLRHRAIFRLRPNPK